MRLINNTRSNSIKYETARFKYTFKPISVGLRWDYRLETKLLTIWNLSCEYASGWATKYCDTGASQTFK